MLIGGEKVLAKCETETGIGPDPSAVDNSSVTVIAYCAQETAASFAAMMVVEVSFDFARPAVHTARATGGAVAEKKTNSFAS